MKTPPGGARRVTFDIIFDLFLNIMITNIFNYWSYLIYFFYFLIIEKKGLDI